VKVERRNNASLYLPSLANSFALARIVSGSIEGKTFMGGWIDLEERKLVGLPPELREDLNQLPHTNDFKILTKEDTRKFGKSPKNLEQ